jgi:predicted regulator of Ras-like GTPase activity (Roadblock/LC7/MglB family)
MTRADLLAEALDEFLGTVPEVEAAAIVSADGLPIASALPSEVHEDRLAAMSAALLILGERAASGLGKGDLAQVMVESADGYIVLMAAGPHAVFVAVTSTAAKAGLLLFEMRRTAARIASLMSDVPAAVGEGDGAATPQGAPQEETATPGSSAEPSVPTWH